MRKSQFLFGVTLLLSSMAGCSGGSGSAAAATRQKSSTLTVAVVPGTAAATNSAIPVAGGSVELQAAVFHLDRVVIEENAGSDGGGENGSTGAGEDTGGSSGNEGGGNGESQGEHVTVAGPFSIDIATGGAVLDSVSVFPGTFRKADLFFSQDAQPPMSGDAIRVTGNYQPTVGSPIKFMLSSQFHGKLEVMLPNGGITVGASVIMPITLTFDLTALFGSLDFANAELTNGEIVVDATHNADLLTMFESSLLGCVDADEHEHG